jgi:D-alanyl-D-alanine carboxypeptidase
MKTKTMVAMLLISLALINGCRKKETPADPNQALIDKLKFCADSVINNTPVPGLVALVVDYKRGINWLYAPGVSNKVTLAPMDANQTFRIASNTKTFTVTVLLQLVGEGKIALNDKLSKFLPEYPAADSMTLAMLCNMTSGLFDYFDDVRWSNSFKSTPLRVWAPSELSDMSFSHPLLFQPGTQFKYTNSNTIILGMVIEKVTGNTVETEITNRIIQSLQLVNTGINPSGTALPGNHGRGYNFSEMDITGDVTESYDVSNSGAAGAAYTTPRELQQFVERLVKGGFLPDSLQYRRLNKDFQTMSVIQSYGLGLSKLGTFYGHNGVVWGYTSSMWHSLDKQCTVIIYYNTCQVPQQWPDNLFLRFMEILYSRKDF